jgi:hypothetical protein
MKIPPAPPSTSTDFKNIIERVFLEIRDAINKARQAGIDCHYPKEVQFEISNARFVIPFPFDEQDEEILSNSTADPQL